MIVIFCALFRRRRCSVLSATVDFIPALGKRWDTWKRILRLSEVSVVCGVGGGRVGVEGNGWGWRGGVDGEAGN